MAAVLLIFFGFIVALGVAGAVANSRRKRALAAMASAKQWQLTKKDRRLPDTFGGRPFATGHDRIARIVLNGWHNGHAILVIDYEYKTPASTSHQVMPGSDSPYMTPGNNSDDTHNYWAACVVDLPVPLPAVEVVPRKRHASHAAGPGILAGAPEFVRGDPGFDQRYLVTTLNQQLAADILDPKVLWLIASWPDFAWRIEGTRLLTWGKGKVKPVWVETSLNMLVALAEAFPAEVWRTARG
ncbi:hypothetical protein Caci_1738 [Catenulispora acidiphila DSM 44928]|uniref:Uncharacterized protein n=1 Tax=Catenulispora acidiphila (strain DSM 44928 / JCM 14897 / NBRC 102108 / NRRL B-24433 / ID139908) TaxID=479433 RepID=C7QCU9_CATAD|nr:hypothetical protein [Catenulispora acidiphila]ACU70659.1 hypothetical protein Caci_1738 [Catenulispora acidiphila DSM 44928]